MTVCEQVSTLAATLFEQGQTQAQAGNFQTALDTFNQLIDRGTDDAEAYGHRCVVRHKLGDLAGAIADCQQAIRLYAEHEQLQRHQYALMMLGRLTSDERRACQTKF